MESRIKWVKLKNKKNKLNKKTYKIYKYSGGSRDFEKEWRSMSATLFDRQIKFQVSDGLERPK